MGGGAHVGALPRQFGMGLEDEEALLLFLFFLWAFWLCRLLWRSAFTSSAQFLLRHVAIVANALPAALTRGGILFDRFADVFSAVGANVFSRLRRHEPLPTDGIFPYPFWGKITEMQCLFHRSDVRDLDRF